MQCKRGLEVKIFFQDITYETYTGSVNDIKIREANIIKITGKYLNILDKIEMTRVKNQQHETRMWEKADTLKKYANEHTWLAKPS